MELDRLGDRPRPARPPVIIDCSSICRRTLLRRIRAWTGMGERIEVVRRADQPASNADCDNVRSFASIAKYERAAAWMPYAPCPKYTVFRYFVRIWSLVELILELPRQERLVDLALERLVVAHVQLLHRAAA
jgi:hypothetical protein